jgi:hypothetical protein
MKAMRFSPLLLLAMAACSTDERVAETDGWNPFPGALADTESRDLTSEVTGRTYRISVALPEDYATANKTYPVLYAVDANTQFGTVVEAARLLHLEETVPELIIVGIGYPVGWLTNGDGSRLVDLTPTVDSSKGGGGEAPGFLEFMRRELIPFVEAEFRARPTGRALYGHSLGGLFALYTLFAGEGTFERYIAGSPSFGWDDRVILRQEAAYAESHDFLSAHLFLSSGSLENSEEWGESVADVEKFVAKLETRSYRELRVATAYLSDETHISVIPATVSRGLRAVYEGFVLSEHD